MAATRLVPLYPFSAFLLRDPDEPPPPVYVRPVPTFYPFTQETIDHFATHPNAARVKALIEHHLNPNAPDKLPKILCRVLQGYDQSKRWCVEEFGYDIQPRLEVGDVGLTVMYDCVSFNVMSGPDSDEEEDL
jgi:hypothetical protein